MGELLANMADTWVFGAFAFLLGLAVGSFLNVCIYRIPADKSLIWPGSHCTACLRPIAWYDNLPVLSYFVLRGRCRHCGSPYSARYMIVEVATGIIFFGYWLALLKFGIRPGADHLGVWALYMVLACSLIVSGAIDYERKEIYTVVTNVAAAAGIVASFIWPRIQAIGSWSGAVPAYTGWVRANAVVESIVGLVVGAGIVYLTRVIATQAFRKEAMGIGDAYLMAAVGAVLGWEGAVLVFFTAPFFALPYGIWQLVRSRGTEEEDAEAQNQRPPRIPMPWGAFGGTVAGFALLVFAAIRARDLGGWSAAPWIFLAAALASFAFAWYRAGREEPPDEGQPGEPALPRAEESHEVPYGPFLGMAAGLMMLVEHWPLAYLANRGF